MHKKWFKPILSVDLAEFNPDWSGEVHFIYCNTDGPLYFKLEESKCTFIGNNYLEPISITDVNMERSVEPDEEAEDDISTLPIERSEYIGDYVELKKFDLPWFSDEEQFDWSKKNRDCLYEQDWYISTLSEKVRKYLHEQGLSSELRGRNERPY